MSQNAVSKRRTAEKLVWIEPIAAAL